MKNSAEFRRAVYARAEHRRRAQRRRRRSMMQVGVTLTVLTVCIGAALPLMQNRLALRSLLPGKTGGGTTDGGVPRASSNVMADHPRLGGVLSSRVVLMQKRPEAAESTNKTDTIVIANKQDLEAFIAENEEVYDLSNSPDPNVGSSFRDAVEDYDEAFFAKHALLIVDSAQLTNTPAQEERPDKSTAPAKPEKPEKTAVLSSVGPTAPPVTTTQPAQTEVTTIPDTPTAPGDERVSEGADVPVGDRHETAPPPPSVPAVASSANTAPASNAGGTRVLILVPTDRK
ncbi:MAG: hypothetical protein LBJ11_11760 [Oscillospiraceae bacterium]|jgi:hypothetical protein|nr:hypothetical protein [Oscillospiraceae bacterium]